MISASIENFIRMFNWDIITRMYGSSHNSVIGFLSSEWIKKSSDHSVLDGAPNPLLSAREERGQKCRYPIMQR